MIFLSFCQGVLYSTELSIYIIYWKYYNIQLQHYSLVYWMMLLPHYFRPLMGYFLDNIPLRKSRGKSYLILIIILEIAVLIFLSRIQSKINIWWVYVCNFLIVFLISMKEVILLVMSLTMNNYYELL